MMRERALTFSSICVWKNLWLILLCNALPELVLVLRFPEDYEKITCTPISSNLYKTPGHSNRAKNSSQTPLNAKVFDLTTMAGRELPCISLVCRKFVKLWLIFLCRDARSSTVPANSCLWWFLFISILFTRSQLVRNWFRISTCERDFVRVDFIIASININEKNCSLEFASYGWSWNKVEGTYGILLHTSFQSGDNWRSFLQIKERTDDLSRCRCVR